MDQDSKLKEQAHARVATILTIADATGAAVTPAEIQAAALVRLSPGSVQAAVTVSNLVLILVDRLADHLAGFLDDDALERLVRDAQNRSREA